MAKISIYELSSNELAEQVAEIVFQKLKPYFPEQNDEELDTRQGAANFLKISLPTLNKWTKEGKIQGYRIGSSIRYKRRELEEALRTVPNLKYRRS